jgi:hypothetical protein
MHHRAGATRQRRKKIGRGHSKKKEKSGVTSEGMEIGLRLVQRVHAECVKHFLPAAECVKHFLPAAECVKRTRRRSV